MEHLYTVASEGITEPYLIEPTFKKKKKCYGRLTREFLGVRMQSVCRVLILYQLEQIGRFPNLR